MPQNPTFQFFNEDPPDKDNETLSPYIHFIKSDKGTVDPLSAGVMDTASFALSVVGYKQQGGGYGSGGGSPATPCSNTSSAAALADLKGKAFENTDLTLEEAGLIEEAREDMMQNPTDYTLDELGLAGLNPDGSINEEGDGGEAAASWAEYGTLLRMYTDDLYYLEEGVTEKWPGDPRLGTPVRFQRVYFDASMDPRSDCATGPCETTCRQYSAYFLANFKVLK